MAIENSSRCDECNGEFAEGDEVYCGKCVQELRDIIDTKDSEIDDLKQEKDGFIEEIDALKTQIKELGGIRWKKIKS